MNRLRIALVLACAIVPQVALAANPLRLITETYSEWKERLFGSGHPVPKVVDAPASGPIAMQVGHPQRLKIDGGADERDFPKGKSRYRIVELPEELEHASLRMQVMAESNDHGHGNMVFKPYFYLLGDDDVAHDPVEAKPLHLDIRPFRRSRLLGCVKLDKVKRFAVATLPEMIGKSYESDVRDAVQAATPGGFYYTTDAVKVKLPYAATGTLILEVTAEAKSGDGC
jgi:hypothetical protein